MKHAPRTVGLFEVMVLKDFNFLFEEDSATGGSPLTVSFAEGDEP